jgi:pimeloyl-ACP methyl ester carboxylesterase
LNGADIYYEDHGQGEPLFLLHGFGGTASDWQLSIAEFSKQYRVIAWDMRGHGRSTTPDTSVIFLHALAARDLLALMDTLKLDHVKAIGHSSGGIIILYAATMQPARFDAIVPVSAQLYYSVQTRAFIEQHAKPGSSPDINNGERRHGKAKDAFLDRQFYHFRLLQGDPAITPDQLATITARTLIVHGDNDFVPVSQAWEMYQHIPNAHLYIVPNGWHIPMLGPLNGADFRRRVLEFLNGEWKNGFSPK